MRKRYSGKMKIVYVILILILVSAVAFAFFSIRPANIDVSLNAAEDEARVALEDLQENIPGLTSATTATSGADSSLVTTRDLSGQGLMEVPSDVFTAPQLTILDLSHNSLHGTLPAEIRFLENLRVLDLSDNTFTGVPAEVGRLTHLQTLDLSNNPITNLPHEIGNLKHLEVLDLRGTHYSQQDLAIIRQKLPTNVEIKIE